MSDRIFRSCAPLRIEIAGGGTDVEPYASQKGGIVVNSTIDKYAYCSFRTTDDGRIRIRSPTDGSFEAEAGSGLEYDGTMDLAKVVANHYDIRGGFDMYVHSDVPSGSGLGGSSTVIVSIIKAVSEWAGEDLDKERLADLACHLERNVLGLKGGKQDQYAAAYGGFCSMGFDGPRVSVDTLELDPDFVHELRYCSLLCYTGESRQSADIIGSQVNAFKEGTNEEALDLTKELAFETADALRDGDIVRTGELISETWQQKKRFTAMVTNDRIDGMYDAAMAAGAIGGRLSGAGGGGFMYFICEYDKKHDVARELEKRGAVITPFGFDPEGARSWTAESR